MMTVSTKTVIVLGKPRSGTSLTAGILTTLGVPMNGKALPSAFNPKGSYEDWDFDQLNQAILRDAGGDGVLRPPPLAKILDQEGKYRERVRRLVAEKTRSPIWGWKTPSTALVADLYLPFVTNPHIIVVLRNPLANAESLVEFTKHIEPTVTVLDMLRVVDTFEHAILDFLERHQTLPTLFVAFEDILADPVNKARCIAAFLDLTVSQETEGRVSRFCIPRDRIDRARRIGFLKGLPARTLGLVRRCYRDPARSADQVTQALRLTRNVFRWRRS